MYFSTSGAFADIKPWYGLGNQISVVDLQLTNIPVHAREDIVRRWCGTKLREAIEYSGLVNSADFNHMSALGDNMWRFEP